MLTSKSALGLSQSDSTPMETNVQTSAPVAKTRAQAIRDMVQIRLAVNAAGPQIADVLRENGIVPEVDWSKVFPHWLIATVDEHVIGCCQVIPSQPFGYVEFLFVRPSVPFKLRAIALRKLIVQSMSTLHMAGCQYVGGYTDQRNAKFANVLENLRFTKTLSADLYVKRLR